jgi:hypothetical protein
VTKIKLQILEQSTPSKHPGTAISAAPLFRASIHPPLPVSKDAFVSVNQTCKLGTIKSCSENAHGSRNWCHAHFLIDEGYIDVQRHQCWRGGNFWEARKDGTKKAGWAWDFDGRTCQLETSLLSAFGEVDGTGSPRTMDLEHQQCTKPCLPLRPLLEWARVRFLCGQRADAIGSRALFGCMSS